MSALRIDDKSLSPGILQESLDGVKLDSGLRIKKIGEVSSCMQSILNRELDINTEQSFENILKDSKRTDIRGIGFKNILSYTERFDDLEFLLRTTEYYRSRAFEVNNGGLNDFLKKCIDMVEEKMKATIYSSVSGEKSTTPSTTQESELSKIPVQIRIYRDVPTVVVNASLFFREKQTDFYPDKGPVGGTLLTKIQGKRQTSTVLTI